MPESKLIAEFKCPKCSGWWPRLIRFFLRKPESTTVTRVAIQPYKDNGKIPQEAPVAMRRVQVPLLQPTQMALTCPVLLLSYDHCLECGEERLVRAEVVNAPVTFQQQGQAPGQGFGLPPGLGRG